jgi:hypothetical protein
LAGGIKSLRIEIQKTHNSPPLPFRKEGTTPPLIKGRLGGILCNSKGISVIFLIIAMLLMITIGYVFSYLIPTKQRSVRPQIYSPQAFFIAQSGVEFAIRYAADQGWRGATDGLILDLDRLDGLQRNLGNNGRFTINYDSSTDGTLTSTGEIINSTERRVVRVTRFTRFLRLIFNTDPSWFTGTRRARFRLRNVRRTNMTLTGFAASWQSGVTRTITRIDLDNDTVYSDATGYSSDPDLSPPQSFNGGNETVNDGEQITVDIYWSGDTNATNIIIKFFDNTGEGYTFNLDPAGDGLP